MTLFPVPRHEPEVVQRDADKRHFGDDEKCPTTSLRELIAHGVSLSSRYHKADELETMAMMVDALPRDLRARIESIWCDSKASATYSVSLRDCPTWLAMAIGHQLERTCLERFDGHNGIGLSGQDGGQLFLNPRWASDERGVGSSDDFRG